MGNCCEKQDPYEIPKPERPNPNPHDGPVPRPRPDPRPHPDPPDAVPERPTINTKPAHPPLVDLPVVRIHHDDIDEHYERGKDLGVGAFATVFVGTHRATGEDCAIKHVDRTKMYWGNRDALQDEIENLRSLVDAPHVTRLYEVYSPNPKECYLVMELLEGGELFDRILKKRTFTEKEARDVIRGMLEALNYMHKRRIAHRDLKPENLLLVSKTSDTDIKLADFGFARKVTAYNGYRTLCGTPNYLAPEVLERFPAYDTKCDLWSTGVVLFLLLGSYLPFDDVSEDRTFDRIRNGEYDFHPDYWRQVSPSAKHLVISLLTVNPSKRSSARRALEHEWMNVPDEPLARRLLSVHHLQQSIVSDRRGKQKVQAAVHTVMAADRMQKLNDDFDSYLRKRDDDTCSVFTMTNKAIKHHTEPRTVEDSATGLPFNDFYELGETLGKGGFGVVRRAVHKETNKCRAVKIIDRSQLQGHGQEALSDEISALKLLRGGPHIVRLYDVFEEQRHTFIVMEEMKGGELLRRIVDKAVYTEREARSVCKILFSAVDYCHKKKIAHRDLKPENLLLVDPNDDLSIKIADFGFAKKVTKPNCLSTLCGSASYVAPEVLDLTSTGYDQRADCWSLGVIVYILLGGYFPFSAPVNQLANLIIRGEYEFHEKHWMYISPSAKRLISDCLVVDPDHRISAEEALTSDWMTVESETLSGNDLTDAQEQIRKALPKEKLKGAIYTVMLTNKMTSLGDSFTSTLGDMNAIQHRKQKGAGNSSPLDSVPESSGKLFCEMYELGSEFGGGGFSIVHEAVQKQSREEVAVKIVDRRDLHPTDAVALQDEIAALRELAGCPYIVELYDLFEEPDTTFLVMEKMRGGDLIERVITRRHYREADAKAVCTNLLLGVEYFHSKSIANRNIKPENLLLVSMGSDVDVKISDFGYAKKVLYPNSLRTQCGTEGYTAPEILEHRPEYDVHCDIWSLGVCLYILIGGYRPFRGTGKEIMRQIRYGEYEFHDKYWAHVSTDAKDLIRRMMTVDPRKRISATEALKSDWIMADDSTLQSDLRGNQTELKTFKGKAKMRQVVQTMVAMNKMQSLAESYRRSF